MVLGFGLILAAQAAKTITFANDAAPLERVCAQLEAKAGVKIFAAGDLKRDVVEIDVHDVPAEELIKRLADVVDAKAELGKAGWTLTEDPRAVDAHRVRAAAHRLNVVRRAQKNFIAQIEHDGPFDAEKLAKQVQKYSQHEPKGNRFERTQFDEMQAMMRAAPGNRALRRLVATIDPELIAAIPHGGALVFSDPPKRFQLPLGEAGRQCVAEAVEEENRWIATYHSDGKFEGRTGTMVGDPRSDTEPLDPDRTRVFLKFERNGVEELPQVSAMFVRPDGAAPLTVCANLVDPMPSGPRAEPKTAGEVPLALSPRSRTWLSGLASSRSGGAQGDARAWLLNPSKYEPLGFAVSEMVVAAARSRGENLVASLPDDAIFIPIEFEENGKILDYRPSGVRNGLREQGAFVDEGNGWISVRPIRPEPPLDRSALERLMHALDETGASGSGR